ncbi:MAG: chromosomal replication initiator protein DnaA, partial [Gloeomargaritales cyanobacterium]
EPVLTLSLPDQFSRDWTESKYGELLTSFAPIALGHPVTLAFNVDQDRQQRPQMDFFAIDKTEPQQRQSNDINAPLLHERYTFEHFVVGKSNELAAAAAHAVAQAPGRVYNPFFIYGRTGLGKTHLMQAIGHEVLRNRPDVRVTYLSTEQFTNEMVSSIQTRRNAEFRRRFRETDLLLIDDIHFLKGKEATQDEFFHTFNALYEAGRQIVLTSDRPPAEIGGLESRLVSRFQWGMVADIEPPDVEHRIAILQQKAELDHLEVTFPHDVIQYIAETIHSSVRELEGSIIKILAFASLKHRQIDISLAQEVLRSTQRADFPIQSQPQNLSIFRIQDVVAQVWNVTVEGLCSKARVQTLTIPRQLAMLLARTALKAQLIEIGKAFGGRDHSTVIHSITRAQELLHNSSSLLGKYNTARQLLGLANISFQDLSTPN